MTNAPALITTRQDVRTLVRRWQAAGERVVLVPTMGALHDGHLSLVELAARHGDRVIVTIFVNPKQFGPDEDFDKYPRDLAADLDKLAATPCAAVYAPMPDEIYPPGFATTISVSHLTDCLCGAHRPGHFDGVATIVTKLLLQTRANAAVFGEKDYQQLQVITRCVRDLDLEVELIPAPIYREPDGLALSSRNRYLTAAERATAPRLYQTLTTTASTLRQDGATLQCLSDAVQQLTAAGFRVEYLEWRTADTLRPVTDQTIPRDSMPPTRLFAAVYLGTTRLIDNIAV